jgi:hypothetical protein
MRAGKALALAAAAALIVATGAAAELRRCLGPDGKIIFTDDESRCPGTEPIEAPDSIQRVDSQASRPAARGRRDHKLDQQVADAEAERWRQKRLAKEDELRQVASRRDALRAYVSHCNRGGYVLTQDASGIKRKASCTSIRAEFKALDDREASIRGYLANDLQDECRRAGCLPGWIR